MGRSSSPESESIMSRQGPRLRSGAYRRKPQVTKSSRCAVSDLRACDFAVARRPERSRLRGSHGDEDVLPVAVHEQERRAIRRLRTAARSSSTRLHRLTIDLLDDVARLDARVRRAAVRIDLLHEHAARVARQLRLGRQLRRQRRDRDAERRLVVGRCVASSSRALFDAAASSSFTVSVFSLPSRMIPTRRASNQAPCRRRGCAAC